MEHVCHLLGGYSPTCFCHHWYRSDFTEMVVIGQLIWDALDRMYQTTSVSLVAPTLNTVSVSVRHVLWYAGPDLGTTRGRKCVATLLNHKCLTMRSQRQGAWWTHFWYIFFCAYPKFGSLLPLSLHMPAAWSECPLYRERCVHTYVGRSFLLE